MLLFIIFFIFSRRAPYHSVGYCVSFVTGVLCFSGAETILINAAATTAECRYGRGNERLPEKRRLVAIGLAKWIARSDERLGSRPRCCASTTTQVSKLILREDGAPQLLLLLPCGLGVFLFAECFERPVGCRRGVHFQRNLGLVPDRQDFEEFRVTRHRLKAVFERRWLTRETDCSYLVRVASRRILHNF